MGKITIFLFLIIFLRILYFYYDNTNININRFTAFEKCQANPIVKFNIFIFKLKDDI